MRKALTAALAATIALCAGIAYAAPARQLHFATQEPDDHPFVGYMRDMAREISQKTDGRYELVIHTDNELGDYSTVFENLAIGGVDLALISTPGEFDRRLNFVYTHGIASDYGQLASFFRHGDWAYNKMNELCGELDIKFLGFVIEGLSGIGSKKELKEPLNPAVDKGVNCRVPNMHVFRYGAQAMGLRPVTFPLSNLSAAMRDNAFDAITGLPATAAIEVLGKDIKYWYQMNYCVETLSILCSRSVWEALSEEDRAIFEEAADLIAARSIKDAATNDATAMEKMREMGIQVFTYTTEELKPVRDALRGTWQKLEKSMTKRLIEELASEADKL